ncbi:MAG: hypothetical protein JNK94_08485 [Hyphomonadaceae bacterium]|nr:hypothetical protein [Hyphomonadaceae bacterium]
MPRPHPTRLREAAPQAPPETVIEARFKVVREAGRSRWRAFWNWVLAFFAAALIGLLLPPLWVVLQEVMAMMRGA